jgi:hypothetical protein
MKDHTTFFFKVMESRILGLLDLEDEGAIIFKNVGKYSISDTASHSRRLEFSFRSFATRASQLKI